MIIPESIVSLAVYVAIGLSLIAIAFGWSHSRK